MAETPLTDSIEALTAYANQTTGASDTNLSDAVYTLVQGYGGGGDTRPKLVLTYTLEEDFTLNTTTTLATITNNEIQSFFDTCIGVRGSFPVGTFKLFHIDVKSDVTPASDYSYITHFWYDSYFAFPAGSQIVVTDLTPIAPRNATTLSTQQTLYCIRPSIQNISGNIWNVNIQARTTAAPFNIWKAGTYTMTITYMGNVDFYD